jgi:Uma2 family endonuclease
MIAFKNTGALIGPWANGVLMTPREFDRARFERGWRYELLNGVLVVLPSPLENQRDPNDELGRWLRNSQADHPRGRALDATLPEHTVRTDDNRRMVDRAIWCGLGRLPRRSDFPNILVEFVSEGKRNVLRDYETKRDEFIACGVDEYWIIDRFERTMTSYQRQEERYRKRIWREKTVYTTPLLPGFELPLARLFELANRWADDE